MIVSADKYKNFNGNISTSHELIMLNVRQPAKNRKERKPVNEWNQNLSTKTDLYVNNNNGKPHITQVMDTNKVCRSWKSIS